MHFGDFVKYNFKKDRAQSRPGAIEYIAQPTGTGALKSSLFSGKRGLYKYIMMQVSSKCKLQIMLLGVGAGVCADFSLFGRRRGHQY